jgi:hypothetical protein
VRNSTVGARDAAQLGIEAPLSHAQEMMWFLDRTLSDPTTYSVAIAWRVRGSIDAEALRGAVNRLAQRHEPLRTAFFTADGRPVAMLLPDVDVSIHERAAGSDEAEVRELLREEARRPFDLAQAPLFRVMLVRGFEEDALLFTFHHIVCDCWSLAIVAADFLELYDAEWGRREPVLPAIAAGYTDFARADREAAANAAYEENLDWWADHLRDLPRFELAGDPVPAAPNTRGARITRTLGSQTTHRVRSFARAHRTTTFATLLAAYAALLAASARKNEVVIGVPMAGRRRPELNPLVGDFTEMTTLRIAVDQRGSFAALAGSTQDELLDALTYGAAPFGLVVERVAPDRSRTHQPLFTVAMVEQQPLRDGVAGGILFEPLALDTLTAKFDLLLEVAEDRDDLTITFEYASARFGEPTAAALIDAYLRLVSDAVTAPDAPLQDAGPAQADFSVEPGTGADRARTAAVVENAPQPSTLDARLRSLFEEILEVPEVAIDENFFALGGHSLLAAQLMARVEETFPLATARFHTKGGRSSLLRVFYREPTVCALAATLEGIPEPGEAIVRMREGRLEQPAVFWFHGQYNWNGLYAWNILGALPGDVPFYLVHPHGHDDEPFASDIGILVEERLEELRRVRPHGPYIIGGWCNGAIMAFEAARRLRASGETVENLVMCQTPPLVALAPSLARFAHGVGTAVGLSERKRVALLCVLRAISSRVEGLARGTPEHRVAMVKRTMRTLLGATAPDPRGSFALNTAEAAERHQTYLRAITSYDPPRYGGRADIIYGDDVFVYSGRPDGGWGSRIATAFVHRVPGPARGDIAGEIGAIMRRLIDASTAPRDRRDGD